MEETKQIEYTTSQEIAKQFPEFQNIFQNIRIYGSESDPLFLAQDILPFVGIKKFRFNEDFIDRDMVKIQIKQFDQNRQQVAFTERGLYKAILKSKTDLAERFYDFIYIVMKDLRTIGKVELNTAFDKLKAYEKAIDKEHQLMQKYQHESERYYLKYTSMWMENTIIKDKLKNETSVSNRHDPTYQNQRLKERFFKKIYVYISKPPKPVEDEFEEWDPDMDPTDDEEICFFISKSDRKTAVAELYIDPSISISRLKEKLIELDFTIKLPDNKTHDTIFRGTLDNLRETINNLSDL